jgi:hypothetical protein
MKTGTSSNIPTSETNLTTNTLNITFCETENIFESNMDFDEEDLGMMIENPRPKTSGRDRGEGFGNRPSTG